MSLINDMLNDLDARRESRPETADELQWLGTGGSTSVKKQLRLRWVSLLLLIIAISVVGWLYRPVDTIEMLANQLEDKDNTESVSVVPAVAKIDNHLSDIHFKFGASSSSLLFEFSEKATYEIIPQGNNVLLISIFGINNNVDVARLKPEFPIDKMTFQQNGLALTISIKMTVPVTYEARMVTDKETNLEIILYYPPQILTEALSEGVSNKGSTSKQPQDESVDKITSKKTETNDLAGAHAVQLEQVIPNTTIKTARKLSMQQRDTQTANAARKLLEQRRAAEAEDVLLNFLQQHPLAKKSAELQASILFSQQRFTELEWLLLPLREAYPNAVSLLALDARWRLQKNDPEGAVKLLMSKQPPIQSHPDYYELLALAARQNSQYLLSEQAYKGLLDTNAGVGDWWIGMALAMDAQGKISAAKAAYRQALKISGTSPALADYARQRLTATES